MRKNTSLFLRQPTKEDRILDFRSVKEEAKCQKTTVQNIYFRIGKGYYDAVNVHGLTLIRAMPKA